MSYRLINANAIKYNSDGCVTQENILNMPCIYADFPNGIDGKHYDVTEWKQESTVKAIPIEKLEQIRAEIKEGLYGPEEMSETDSERAEAFNNGLNYCIEIIDKAIKEQNE